MTKSLTINNFIKTTETLTHDKKLIKQWRNTTTQGYYMKRRKGEITIR